MNQNYKDMSKDVLIDLINDLKNQVDDLLKKEDDKFFVEFPWAGNLGQWYWYVKENRVVFNDKKSLNIGYNPRDIGQVGFEFFTDKLHPDDYEAVMENMRQHLYGKTDAYEVEYRIQHNDGHYVWYYDRGVISKRDDKGNPLLLQGIVFDISESKKIEERLTYLSERDGLTNVYNRRTMFKKLSDLIHTHNVYGEAFSLIMFDIDHFKKVNDTYGHLVGDDVLRKLSSLIHEDKRKDDIVCRYGGEEFFLLLPNTSIEGAKQLAKRLHGIISDMKIKKVGSITVSMGVVEHKLDEAIDEVVKRVDDLVYKAKDAGRNTIKFE